MKVESILSKTYFALSEHQTISISVNDKICSQISIKYNTKCPQSVDYFEQISYFDLFSDLQAGQSHRQQSIIFLKLALQKALIQYRCDSNTKQNYWKRLKIIKTKQIIWQKCIIGKSNIAKTLSSLNIQQQQQYNQKTVSQIKAANNDTNIQCILLMISYPQQILIVLPKLLDSDAAKLATLSESEQQTNHNTSSTRIQQSTKARKILFSHLHQQSPVNIKQ